MNQRLIWYLEQNALITEEQYDFQKQRLTYNCHTKIETNICETLTYKQHML